MSDQACCAHLHVEWKREDYTYEGPDIPNPDPTSPHVGLRKGQWLTRSWWECRDCKTPFIPRRLAEFTSEDVALLEDLALGYDIRPLGKAIAADLRSLAQRLSSLIPQKP